MGNKKNSIIILLIYVLCTIILTVWYIILHRFEELINIKSISKVVVSVGLVGAIVPTIIFSLSYYLLKKVANKALLAFLLFLFFIILLFLVYWITINMVFYHIDDSISFLQSLMEII